MKKEVTKTARKNIDSIFRKHRGFLTAAEAFEEGIQSRDLYALRDDGTLEQLARGLFRHCDFGQSESSEFLALHIKIPKGVVCLTSALAFHGVILKKPNEISIALAKGSQKPRNFPFPHKLFFISEPAFSSGIEVHTKDDFQLRVYSVEKTLIDCFKFRNKIGLEVCIEGLKNWLKRQDKRINKLHTYAKVCRMEKVIAPYLQALSLEP